MVPDFRQSNLWLEYVDANIRSLRLWTDLLLTASAFLYIAEAAAMLSYPEEHRRGMYISIWVGMRNVGSIIGGAISFGLNIASNGAGGVTTNTYLVFLGMECIGMFDITALSF